MIHIEHLAVNTRFQQHVHNLTALGAARLQLFETFCLPSMIHQTSNKIETGYRFLWIIKIDPKLDVSTKNKMINMLRPFPNFFLVGSNNNFGASYGSGTHRGSWRSGHAGLDVLYGNASTPKKGKQHHHLNNTKPEEQPLIYTGNVALLQVAHSLRDDKIILETRLDADDGLPLTYLEFVQQSAIDHLSVDIYNSINSTIPEYGDPKNSTPYNNSTHTHSQEVMPKKKWMYWCISDSLLWYPTVMVDGFKNSHIRPSNTDPGKLVMEYNSGKEYCLTPGLTSGISVGVKDSDVPRYSHVKLFRKLTHYKRDSKHNCSISDTDLEHKRTECIHLYHGKAYAPIRARTPTSAGMSNVVLPPNTKLLEYSDEFMESKYGIQNERLVQTNHHFYNNLTEIVMDNLQGQCTKGHSCKSEARKMLKAMIDYSSHARKTK